MYASFLGTSEALHLDVFDQPKIDALPQEGINPPEADKPLSYIRLLSR